VDVQESSPIAVTDSAARKLTQLLIDQGQPESMLRVFIEGGGCSGFQYGFEFAEHANDDDTVIERAGVKVVVDALSYQYLVGAELDYKEDLMGSRFVVSNPNAVTTCGCGASFGM
jgi:iron-sulfur cluster insertion protein